MFHQEMSLVQAYKLDLINNTLNIDEKKSNLKKLAKRTRLVGKSKVDRVKMNFKRIVTSESCYSVGPVNVPGMFVP